MSKLRVGFLIDDLSPCRQVNELIELGRIGALPDAQILRAMVLLGKVFNTYYPKRYRIRLNLSMILNLSTKLWENYREITIILRQKLYFYDQNYDFSRFKKTMRDYFSFLRNRHVKPYLS